VIKFRLVAIYAERTLKAAVARRSRDEKHAKRTRDRELRRNELAAKRKRSEHERHLRARSHALRKRLACERNMTMDEMLIMRETARP